MEKTTGGRRFRFEDKTSDVAWTIDLPLETREGQALKKLLRGFLEFFGALARRMLE